jgi:O-acetyl-ADP-ribose deacetylase (regulator of RNase III)
MKEMFLDGRLIVKVGDLTEEKVDAIVNAANWTLMGGGGVDGAIHRRGGPEILEECRRIRETDHTNGLPTGQAVITTGGNLPARHVIHTVGPIYGRNGGRDAALLADCYRNSLKVAAENELSTISFPSISAGAFYFPKHEAAPVVADAGRTELSDQKAQITVFLVFFNSSDADIFLRHSGL